MLQGGCRFLLRGGNWDTQELNNSPEVTGVLRKLLQRHRSCCCCCSIAKSCPALCDRVDCTRQASLSFTVSGGLLKLMSIMSMITSNHRILCPTLSSCLQSFPATGSLTMSWLFAPDSQSIGASASASVLPMNIQGWFPLGWTSLISLLSKGLSRLFSSTTVWKHQFFSAQLSLWKERAKRFWKLILND